MATPLTVAHLPNENLFDIIKASLPSELVIQILPASNYTPRGIRLQHRQLYLVNHQRWRLMECPNTFEGFFIEPLEGESPPRDPLNRWESDKVSRPAQAATDANTYRWPFYADDITRERLLGPKHTVQSWRQASRRTADLTAAVIRTFTMPCQIVGPGLPNFDILPPMAKDILLRTTFVSIRPTYYDDIDYTPFLSQLASLQYVHLDAIELFFDEPMLMTQDIHLGLYLGDERAHNMILDTVEPFVQLPFRSRTDPIDHPTESGKQLPPQGPILVLRWFRLMNYPEPSKSLRVLIGKTVEGDSTTLPRNRPFIIDMEFSDHDGMDWSMFPWEEVYKRTTEFLDAAQGETNLRLVKRKMHPVADWEDGDAGQRKWNRVRNSGIIFDLDPQGAVDATYVATDMHRNDLIDALTSSSGSG